MQNDADKRTFKRKQYKSIKYSCVCACVYVINTNIMVKD